MGEVTPQILSLGTKPFRLGKNIGILSFSTHEEFEDYLDEINNR